METIKKDKPILNHNQLLNKIAPSASEIGEKTQLG
jgi:hypothetical protein